MLMNVSRGRATDVLRPVSTSKARINVSVWRDSWTMSDREETTARSQVSQRVFTVKRIGLYRENV